MSASRTFAAAYLESLLAGQPELPESPLARLNKLRAEAVDRVGVLTVPTIRDEEWRFTDLSLLTKLSFQPVRTPAGLTSADVERFHVEEATTRLVFVDGIHAPELSSGARDGGVVVTNLFAAESVHAAAIELHLGRHAQFHDSVFAALNTAFLHDGALVIVPRDVSAAAPVHLLFIATQKGAASYPRCLLVAESGSAVTVVEDYVALQTETYLTNTVTEIALGDRAHVDHIRVQRDSGQAFHIANCAVSLANGSRYRSVSVALGARISRYDLNVLHAAEGAECTIDGLALIGERQLADTHSCIDHAKPNGVSRQLHKCIAGGAAHAVFNGKIIVRPDAQRTNSSQSSRNLLLTPKAHVDTKPQLEIFADDVKCAHGATVGQLDSEALFYLTSRGLSNAAARNLLTYAFGAEIIDRIPVASLKLWLERTVLEQTARKP
ncbi:MAG TPA: Fe-S cluster assembly protein SufD [Casimicrobiaceae bacterium]|jgi:Fe-S cluster assembly protein SufD|nr:Fe-S cluster assembly protein SufD [Casimicrobiaceae bacterium]